MHKKGRFEGKAEDCKFFFNNIKRFSEFLDAAALIKTCEQCSYKHFILLP